MLMGLMPSLYGRVSRAVAASHLSAFASAAQINDVSSVSALGENRYKQTPCQVSKRRRRKEGHPWH